MDQLSQPEKQVANMKIIKTVILGCLSVLISATCAQAQVDIFLDFNADWVTNLNESTNAAGVADFDATERLQIQTIIEDTFTTAFAPFLLNFSTTEPGGIRERVNFGANTDGGGFGSAPLDFRNRFQNLTQNVFAANFGGFIESNEPRSQQIQEIATSLAGTGVHELGHSLGLRHHAAYGTPGITPSNYNNTQGLQNAHYLATGSTGLNEIERESTRTFSTWSNVLLEAALGVTANPLELQTESGDAGDGIAGAQVLNQTFLDISGQTAGLVNGNLDAITDIDVYAFEATAAGTITAELWSDDLFTGGTQFDSVLRLLDSDGLTLGFSDDVLYNGDTFAGITTRESDSFLLNIALPSAGTYFLEVSSFSNLELGEYELIFGHNAIAAVPEPGGTVLLGIASALTLIRRKRA